MIPDLRAAFEARTGEMAALLGEFVSIESPSLDKAAVDRMGERVRRELIDLGAEVIVHPRAEVGDILEARWNADAPGRPLLFVCHMDTVHPIGSLARNPLREEEGRLYGPGSFDMKGGIVTTLTALRGLREMGILPQRPLIALMTSDEEIQSAHSRALIEERAAGAALAMILEPALPDGSVKTWRKAVGSFHVRTLGRAAHAGVEPEAGINAVEEMAHQIIRLQALSDFKAGSTVTVGRVMGGTRSNVVPEQCDASVDARAMTTAEMERISAAIRALRPVLPGAQVEVTGGFDRPPMERSERMMATFAQAKAIAARHGLTLRESGTGGASDGNFTAALGTPTLDGLGPMGQGAHTSHEHVIIGSLARSATLLAALVLEWPSA